MAKILIVDDDPDIVDACRLFLEKEGHQVFAAYNRDEGMTAVEAEKPQLMILDVMMEQPDDGIAMARELRKRGFTAPIVMMTSVSRVTGMEFGADKDMVPVDAFLDKPVDPATLNAKINELLK